MTEGGNDDAIDDNGVMPVQNQELVSEGLELQLPKEIHNGVPEVHDDCALTQRAQSEMNQLRHLRKKPDW